MKVKQMEYYQLSNGVQMPKLGLGTDYVFYLRQFKSIDSRYWGFLLKQYRCRIQKPYLEKQQTKTISKAIQLGYRLIDTSSSYHNEDVIGRAVQKSGVNRKDIFITTRVSNSQQMSRTVRESFFQSLKRLRVDYVDLFQIHWPVPNFYLDTWREIEKLYREGYVRSIGVANCHQHHIEAILNICEIAPMVNEIEVHPLLSQKPLIEYCKKNDILVEAYTPLARNDERLKRNKFLLNIAEKYHKTPMQIILRWHIENGVCPIPRSMDLNRLAQNLDVFDFQLTKEEVSQIDSININSRLRFDPDNCDFSIL